MSELISLGMFFFGGYPFAYWEQKLKTIVKYKVLGNYSKHYSHLRLITNFWGGGVSKVDAV